MVRKSLGDRSNEQSGSGRSHGGPFSPSGGYKTTPWKANLFASPCAVALVRTSVFPAAFVCFLATAMALIYGLVPLRCTDADAHRAGRGAAFCLPLPASDCVAAAGSEAVVTGELRSPEDGRRDR